MRKFIYTALVLLSCALAGAREKINPTPSPDGKMEAYTDSSNNLFVCDIESGKEIQLSFDGSELILNGYASWVYYEEIFGRPSKYRAFWWSPDSKKIAYYRFDNSRVGMFPIYDEKGVYGSLTRTRYPKAGEPNPSVRVAMVDLGAAEPVTTWADFDEAEDQYFGTPFWGADSRQLFVQWMPRVQQDLVLYAVKASDGSKSRIYSEHYDTWIDWMEDMVFTKDGLYMARSFEDGWQQIYFLSYNGKTLRRVTSGPNWNIDLLDFDKVRRELYFTAQRDSDIHSCLYKVDRSGRITRLTPAEYQVASVSFEKGYKAFTATLTNINTPYFEYPSEQPSALPEGEAERKIVYLTLENGLKVPAMIQYPDNFNRTRKYPVVMEIYGGPNTAYVRDYYTWKRGDRQQWYRENGIIYLLADSRAAGHNGRAGVDCSYRDVVSAPVEDFCAWARWLQSQPYVDGSRIGVEGFSFGGTMTSMLVMNHPDLFRCGVAGGGVYDWVLYDSHYTERYMDTPQRNPEGYETARVLSHTSAYDPSKSFLKLTHGTADDNVHLQNTLQLMDTLQRGGKQFELMLYPGGYHGYRGVQHQHDFEADKAFWTRYLINQN